MDEKESVNEDRKDDDDTDIVVTTVVGFLDRHQTIIKRIISLSWFPLEILIIASLFLAAMMTQYEPALMHDESTGDIMVDHSKIDVPMNQEVLLDLRQEFNHVCEDVSWHQYKLFLYTLGLMLIYDLMRYLSQFGFVRRRIEDTTIEEILDTGSSVIMTWMFIIVLFYLWLNMGGVM